MTQASRIIEKFGGVRPMSEATDIPATTIQHWLKTGSITGSVRMARILDAASARGLEITADDLIAQDAAPTPDSPVGSVAAE